jgi:hypothetical protein
MLANKTKVSQCGRRPDSTRNVMNFFLPLPFVPLARASICSSDPVQAGSINKNSAGALNPKLDRIYRASNSSTTAGVAGSVDCETQMKPTPDPTCGTIPLAV